MSILITPHIQATGPQAATTAPVVLQAGTVISARVAQILTSDTVRITIGSQSLDVQSQVPLQAGQVLQLAVSQTPDGTVRLAVVSAQDGAPASPAPADASGAGAATDSVTLAPAAAASVAAQSAPATITPTIQLTPQEALAVSVATQTAAAQQTSLAPLFANLAVAAGLPSLPPQVLQAVGQVLAQQTNLDQNLTGNDIKQAFQSSGLFLEASLAAGTPPSPATTPDLKAALIVLRQVLTTSLNAVPAPQSAVPPAAVAAVAALGTAPSAALQVAATPATPVAQLATTLAAATVATPVPQGASSIVVPQGTPAAAVVIEQGTPAPPIVLSQLVPISSVQGTPLTVSPALAPLLASEIVTPAASLLPAGVAECGACRYRRRCRPNRSAAGGHGRRGRACSRRHRRAQPAAGGRPGGAPDPDADRAGREQPDARAGAGSDRRGSTCRRRSRDGAYQRAAAADQRRLAHGAAGHAGHAGVEFAGGIGHAPLACRYRRRDRASNPAAGGLAAGACRYHGTARGSHRAALEFRNPVRDPAGNRDGPVRDFARGRRQRDRGRQAGMAGAVLARRRAGGAGSCAGVARRRQDLGANVGGAARDRGAIARGHAAVEPGAQQGRAAPRRYRDPRRHPPQPAPARAGHFLDRAL